MRTKILKFGMPLMAFLLAVVFAFATNEEADKDVLVTGYIFSNNNCNVVSHDCNPFEGDLCTIGGKTVYRTKSGTQCSNPMFRL